MWVAESGRGRGLETGGLENVSSEFIVAGVTGPSKGDLQWSSKLCPWEPPEVGPEFSRAGPRGLQCPWPLPCHHCYRLGLLSDEWSMNLKQKHRASSLSLQPTLKKKHL